MYLSPIDVAIVIAYIVCIFLIALSAHKFMKKRNLHLLNEEQAIQNQYLAGKSITFWEAVLSIVATEFSAMAFLYIPTYVYFENLSYLRFIIGACISRSIIAYYFLPKFYGRGLTIFEALARGIHAYPNLRREGINGKRTFAFFYLITKLIGVSVKLLGGAILVSEFFDTPLFVSIALISAMTYLYIMLGGLKAVVRTDMLQASIFIIGGIIAHFVVGKMSSFTWGELVTFGFENGKFSLFNDSGLLSFLYGVLAGFVYDAATHGVDQDLTQKLMGSRNIETAQKALAWSALGSFFVNLLFLSLGVILWAYYTKHGQVIPQPEKLFSSLIENYFPTPMRGLMVASILAASMSTLDSSINAMSAVFWNDFMSVEKSKNFRTFINTDNFIITLSIVVLAYLCSMVPGALKFGMQFAYLTTAPLLALFTCRMLLSKYIFIGFSPSLIFLSICSCLLGMGLNQFRFGFNPQLTILWGIITTTFFMWMYTKISNYLISKENEI
jgi:Na+/proline symporter